MRPKRRLRGRRRAAHTRLPVPPQLADRARHEVCRVGLVVEQGVRRELLFVFGEPGEGGGENLLGRDERGRAASSVCARAARSLLLGGRHRFGLCRMRELIPKLCFAGTSQGGPA